MAPYSSIACSSLQQFQEFSAVLQIILARVANVFVAVMGLRSHKTFVYTQFKVQKFQEFGAVLQIILARVANVFVAMVVGLWS